MDRPRLLIIDTGQRLHDQVERLFGSDIEVRTADSGSLGLETAQSWQPHLIVVEQRMPGVTGIALLASIRDLFPEATRVLTAATKNEDLLLQALQRAEIHYFLERPVSDASLRIVAGAMLREQRLIGDKEQLASELFDVQVRLDKIKRTVRQQQTLLSVLMEERSKVLHEAISLERKSDKLERTNNKLERTNNQLERTNNDLLETNEQLRYTLMRDNVSKLFNRQYLDEYLRIELSRAARYQRAVAVVLIQVNSLRTIASDLGSNIADAVVRDFGQILKPRTANNRSSDVAGRYDGEQFLLILPETNRVGAERKMEKLKAQIADHEWSQLHPKLKSVEAQLGLAMYPDDGDSVAELLTSADRRTAPPQRTPVLTIVRQQAPRAVGTGQFPTQPVVSGKSKPVDPEPS